MNLRLFVLGALIVLGLVLAGPISEGATGTGRIAVFLGLLVYILPTLVAGLREKRHPGAVVVVNLFLGWTFIGWVVALAMAFAGDTKRDVLAVRAGRA